jgi:hypothetical protein
MACTNNRRPILAEGSVQEALVRFAEQGMNRGAWLGAYVLMATIFMLSWDSTIRGLGWLCG